MRQLTNTIGELATRWTAGLSVGILSLATLVYFVGTRRYSLLQWDDAYITYRFAQHLAQGFGLVWNIGGERVEGFTSLLHVLLLAIADHFTPRPELVSIVIGIASVLLTVGMIALVLRQLFGQIVPAAAVVLGLYLVDPATMIHTTSGLETQLFVVTLCAAFSTAWFFIDTPRWQTGVGLSVLVFLSVLTRPEGVLYGVALYGVLAVYGLYVIRQTNRIECLKYVGLSAVLLVSLGTVYAVGKYSYFGYLLPNPFYVKSNQVALQGIEPVWEFLQHTALWYVPITTGFVLLAGRDIFVSLGNSKTWVKMGLILITPLPALIYYMTITHEVGGAYRFTYPTYFYFVVAAAIVVSAATRRAHARAKYVSILSMVAALYLLIPIIVQGSWHVSLVSRDPFMEYHWKIALALKETGLGSDATVLTDAAGVIPYVSEFNQVDRVGLTDNFLSGRQKITLEEREQYLWSRPIDVYIGYEPPAQIGAQRPEDDLQMHTSYVNHLLTRRLVLIEDRIFVQDPVLLHARMRELRDHWDWLGEIAWAGTDAWGLKAFVYVRKDSPNGEILESSLRKIVNFNPTQINLNLAQ